MRRWPHWQRRIQQAGLDVGYQDYLRQQGYPEQKLGFMSNILAGVPAQPTTTFYDYQQPGSLFSNMLGAGLGAAAMYNNTRG